MNTAIHSARFEDEAPAPRCAQCDDVFYDDPVSTEVSLCSMKCATLWLRAHEEVFGDCQACAGPCRHSIIDNA